jgi:hypothetical protein
VLALCVGGGRRARRREGRSAREGRERQGCVRGAYLEFVALLGVRYDREERMGSQWRERGRSRRRERGEGRVRAKRRHLEVVSLAVLVVPTVASLQKGTRMCSARAVGEGERDGIGEKGKGEGDVKHEDSPSCRHGIPSCRHGSPCDQTCRRRSSRRRRSEGAGEGGRTGGQRLMGKV